MNKLVSVVISTYNAAEYIEDMINSVLYQTYSNLELIIVDDGSTDNTLQILKKYEYFKNVVLFKKEHSGNIGKNLNYGIKKSKGFYVCVSGADDVWELNKINEQLAYMSEYKCVSSNASIIDTEGNNLSEKYFCNFYNNKELHLEDILLFNYIIASTVLIEKNILDLCGYFDEVVGNRAEDYYLWLKISEYFPILFINKSLVKYRKHNLNISNKSLKDINLLSIRSIELREKYLLYKNPYSKAATNGILMEYSQIIKYLINVKEYSLATDKAKLARKYINNKYSIKYIKYLVIPLIIRFYYSIFRRCVKN